MLETPARGTILVVEDNPDHRLLMGDVLAGAGYGIIEASTAEQALVHLRGPRVDVIVLDYGLPGQDGLTCCAASVLTESTHPFSSSRRKVRRESRWRR